jgi:CBS domain-containing protein
MRVRDIMSTNVACCSPDAGLAQVAQMMVENDCGEIPVINSSGAPIGVVTDRDIICRIIAKGENPLTMQAGDAMSTPCVTVSPESTLERCCEVLEKNQIRRVLVVDGDGALCGLVAQADIARHAPQTKTANVVKKVSQPSSLHDA